MFFPIFVLYSLLINTVFAAFTVRAEERDQRHHISDRIRKMLVGYKVGHEYINRVGYEADLIRKMGDGDSSLILCTLSKELMLTTQKEIFRKPLEPFRWLSDGFSGLLYPLIQELRYFVDEEISVQDGYGFVFQGQLKSKIFGLDSV
jgi:hypothetical protein